MIAIKSAREIEIMRRSGKVTAAVLSTLIKTAKAGVTLRELDRIAEKGILERGGVPTFKGYHGFPASICASVNEVVVHGIPGDYALKDGDILSIDIGSTFENYVSDSAVTFGVGTVSAAAERSFAVGRAARPPSRSLYTRKLSCFSLFARVNGLGGARLPRDIMFFRGTWAVSRNHGTAEGVGWR